MTTQSKKSMVLLVVLALVIAACVPGATGKKSKKSKKKRKAAPVATAPAFAPAPQPIPVPAGQAPAPAANPGTPAASAIGGCPLMPANSFWHADISRLPVHPQSAAWVNSSGAGSWMHMDFGSGLWNGGPIGIPVTVTSGNVPPVPIAFQYHTESDAGPYPLPSWTAIEGGSGASGDRHAIVVDTSTCLSYELYNAHPGSTWLAGSGAIFNLTSNAMRPLGWTSADAAGLPILPGLVRYDEVAAGVVDHAIRIAVPRTRNSYIWPASHQAGSSNDPNLPPMGAWFRLRADADLSGLSYQARVIAEAMQRHGLVVADNGAPWHVIGVPDERWNNQQLHELHRFVGANLEAVDASSISVSPNSYEVR